MTLVVAAPLLCILALVMAAVEIEIEGPYGWAEKLPTPYRVSGLPARVFGLVLGGKPLTGYNLLMFAATLLAFHLPFAFGAPWTAASELALLAAWVSWSALWDLLWFLLNPACGWRRFRRGNVWWRRRWLWRLPLDYWVAMVASLVLAALAQAANGGAAGEAAPAGSEVGRWRRRRSFSPRSPPGRWPPACSRRSTGGCTHTPTRPPSTSAAACGSRRRPGWRIPRSVPKVSRAESDRWRHHRPQCSGERFHCCFFTRPM